MRTVEQWAYGATLDYYDRWLTARRDTESKRPRRTGGRLPLMAALVAAMSVRR